MFVSQLSVFIENTPGALARVTKLLADNKVDIRKLEEGGYAVTCSVMDGDRALLSVTLRVSDPWQAEQIKEQFLTDPALLYRSNLAVLTGDADNGFDIFSGFQFIDQGAHLDGLRPCAENKHNLFHELPH